MKSGKQKNQLVNIKLDKLDYQPEINVNTLSALKNINPDKKKLRPLEF
jgi:hypothetical protein